MWKQNVKKKKKPALTSNLAFFKFWTFPLFKLRAILMTNLKMLSILNMKFKIACKDHKSDPDQHNLGGSFQTESSNSQYLKPQTTWPLNLQIHNEPKSPKKPNWGASQLAVQYPLLVWLYNYYHLKFSKADKEVKGHP